MLSKQTILAVLTLSFYTATNAQSIGIGGTINYASNGVNVFYSKLSKSKNWTYDAGIRVMINPYSINANKQNYVYYQTGYASNLWEHFSLNFRASRKLFRWRFLELDAMSNLHLTCHSILMKSNTIDYATNKILSTEEWFFKASPAIEITLGLMMQIKLSPKISLFAASGVGYIYFNHKNEGWNRTLGTPVIFSTSIKTPNKIRGDHDFVGLDGLPMLTAGVKYSLK